MDKARKISFLASVRNNGAWIADTAKSILAQTEKDWEWVVVLDNSTDCTKEVLEWFKDDRIRIFDIPEHNGIGWALNYGTKQVKSPYICMASGDDLYNPRRAEACLKYFEKFPATDIYYHAFHIGDAMGLPQSLHTVKEFNKEKLLTKVNGEHVNQYIPHGFCAYKTRVGLDTPYKEDRKYGVDYPFFVDCAHKYSFGCSQDALGVYRIRSNSVSFEKRDEIYKDDKKIVEGK